MMEDRQFDIFKAQCLNIAAKQIIHANGNLGDTKTQDHLFKLATSIVKAGLEKKYLDMSKNCFVEQEASTKLRKKCSGCDTLISANVAEYSERNYRQPLCIHCQKEKGP